MAQNNLLKTYLTEEDFDFLMKDNKVNDEKFQVLDKKGERPGVGEFEKKVSNLTTEILKTRIDLLGDYLKK